MIQRQRPSVVEVKTNVRVVEWLFLIVDSLSLFRIFLLSNFEQIDNRCLFVGFNALQVQAVDDNHLVVSTLCSIKRRNQVTNRQCEYNSLC